MSRSAIDSYTGAPIEGISVSKIKDLNEPRTLYKLTFHLIKASGTYEARRLDGDRWQVLRKPQPLRGEGFENEQPICIRETEADAVRTLDWLIAHDRLVVKALKAMAELDFDPFVELSIKAEGV